MKMSDRKVRMKTKISSHAINFESRGLLASARDILAGVLGFLAEPHG